MSKKRRAFNNEKKFRIVLEAIKVQIQISEIGAEYQVHPNKIIICLHYAFVYLTAIIDWYSKKILSWKVSTTMDTEFVFQCTDV